MSSSPKVGCALGTTSCPHLYKSFTSDLARSLKELASAMTKVADAMEICSNNSFAETLPTGFLLPPPIDTATPAAEKAVAAMAADALEDTDAPESNENAIWKAHAKYLSYADNQPMINYLKWLWHGRWITVGGTSYQIYRYQLYHYNKKDHCITHHGHYNPITKEVTPDHLVPDFAKAPKGYSVRSALYA